MIPEWIKNLNLQDELLLYFPYTGNHQHAEFAGFLENWQPGIRVQYIWKGEVKVDELLYEHYTRDAGSYNNWIAYEVGKK